MSSSLGYSIIGDLNNSEENMKKNKISMMKEKLKLIDNQSTTNSNLSSIDDEDEDGMANFEPMTNPMSMGVEKTKKEKRHSNSDSNNDDAVSKENFTEMSSNFAKQYYNQYIPFSNSNITNSSSNDSPDLLKKLNYMIHLLEDQKDEKVNGITEELVLYCFLGIFIIFVIDSFVKVGKYIR